MLQRQELEKAEESGEHCELELEEILARLGTSGHASSMYEVEEEKQKCKKSKYQAPEYIIVLDDLSSELKSSSLLGLLKWNRHYKSKVIISSQWLHDLLPESRKQIDLFLIFKGFPQEKIALIYKDCDSSVPFEIFYKIYKKSTKKPHSFIYIYTPSDQFRCNFDKQFIIHSHEDM